MDNNASFRITVVSSQQQRCIQGNSSKQYSRTVQTNYANAYMDTKS